MNAEDRQAVMIDLGVAGVELEVGDHVCAFYRGQEERDELLLPFVRLGIANGDKIICSIDHVDPGPRVAAFEQEPGVQESIETGQFLFATDDDTYLEGGTFSHDAVISLWDSAMHDAVTTGGFDFIRGVGEMAWAASDLDEVGEGVLQYERRLQELGRYPQVIMCLYDLDKFNNGEFLLDVLRTHPKVLMGKMVVGNPWYVAG